MSAVRASWKREVMEKIDRAMQGRRTTGDRLRQNLNITVDTKTEGPLGAPITLIGCLHRQTNEWKQTKT